MTPKSAHDIRNIAFIGAMSSGKTSLAEALLAASGAIGSAGSTAEGNTVADFDAMEKNSGHSLYPALVHFEWAEHWINVIDTPGQPDLIGRTLQTLPAVETAAIVINAANGVESATRKLMNISKGKCRLIIINKIDSSPETLSGIVDTLVDTFGSACLPINLPAKDGSQVCDCFFNPDIQKPTLFSSVEEAHRNIIEQVVELDEALMNQYLEQGQSLTPEQLHEPFEQALREGHLIPVCFTSTHSHAGIEALLNIISRLMPDPTEGNPPVFYKGEGPAATEVSVQPDPDAHVVAHVFQISNDQYRGKMGLFRIHQGTVKAHAQLFVGDARKPIRIAHLLRLQGKEQVETPLGVPGDICALSRVEEIHRSAVLHDSHDEDFYHLREPVYPQPVFGLTLITRQHGDEQKLSEALLLLADEDPCLEIGFDKTQRHTIIRGLGEQHLKIILEQLQTRWKLELDTAEPSVPYRETIRGNGEARYRHKKQSGGAGQFGEVALRVEALPRGQGIELGNEVKGGTIPTQFLPAVEKGVRQALAQGVMAGYPVQDVRIVLMDGKHHAVDSNEISFVTAGLHATLEALQIASPVILEPYLDVSVRAEENHFGEISAEFSSRRGHVTGTESPAAGWTLITAQMPMAEMNGFEMRLKAICAGNSEFILETAGYQPAPEAVQHQLIKQYRDKDNG